MTAAMFGLFGVCLAAGIAETVVPGGEKSGTGRVFRLLVALAVLSLLVTPLLSANAFTPDFSGGETEEYYEAVFRKSLDGVGKKEFEAAVTALLAKEFSLREEDVSVTATLADEGLSSLRVTFSGKALTQDPREAEDFLRERFSCEVNVR